MHPERDWVAGMDVELAMVRDFLAEHEPFSMLPADTLDGLPSRLLTRYYRRGSVLVEHGAANAYLFILRSGAVDILDAQGALVERTEVGESFGISSVMTGGPSNYRLVAHADSLCLLLPADEFSPLMASSPDLSRHYLDQQAGRIKTAIASVRAQDAGSAILRTRVRDIVRTAPITITGRDSVRDAATLMTQRRVSALLVTEGDLLVGILTDRDLRAKVVAQGRPATEPVSAIMSPDPLSVSPDTLAFEVLVLMSQRGFHHLPVLEGTRLLGMITAGDLMRLEQANPSYLVGQIERQASVEDLAATASRLPEVVSAAAGQDATAADVSRVVTAIVDALTRKLIGLAEDALGPAPAEYCWVALGSQGRLEAGLGSDQDNALILGRDPAPAEADWFAALAAFVVDGLERCGFPRCPGDMMASNPAWRQSVAGWEHSFGRWIGTPDPDAMLHAQTFLDMRAVHGDRSLAERVHAHAVALVPGSPRFQAHLAKEAQRFEPPLGFFRDFVVESAGEHRHALDLKVGGITPVVQLARLVSLAAGSAALSTGERLRAAAGTGALSQESAASLGDAFEFIGYVRLQHQVRQFATGASVDNYIDPTSLSSFERRHLKEAFGIIRGLQKAVAYRYRTDVT
jgi:CBS domain-containing protein